MIDLSHWDIADEFTAAQVVILMHGQDPNVVLVPSQAGSGTLQPLFLPAYERMRRSYDKARRYFMQAMNPPALFKGIAQKDILQSVGMRSEMTDCDTSDGSHCYFYVWLGDDRLYGFDTQLFSVEETARWLQAVEQPSMYNFGGVNKPPTAATPVTQDIDPLDLPDELDYANLAFRAVKNGYGDAAATFKNNVAEYLTKTYPGLKPEAVQRIATVANPDRSPGRKKRSEK